MLTITVTLYCLLYVTKISDLTRKLTAVIASVSIIAVLADRMIGFLLSVSLIIYSLVKREKILLMMSIFIILIFTFALVANFDTISDIIKLGINKDTTNQVYDPVNLFVLFLVLNGILLPTGFIGIKKSKVNIFKIPLFVSLAGSLSWIVFPGTSAFLPDRWVTIFSIFLSLFSGYGFITLIEDKRIRVFHKQLNNYLLILLPFLFLGSLFAFSPNNSYFNFYNLFHDYIGQYSPMTMQYNSISLQETGSLLSLIDWINQNSQESSLIIGSKHIRGWMEIELKNNRYFVFSDNLTKQILAGKYKQIYLVNSNIVAPELKNYSSVLSYNNTDFSVYHLKHYN